LIAFGGGSTTQVRPETLFGRTGFHRQYRENEAKPRRKSNML